MRSGSGGGEKTSNDQCSGEEGCLDMNTDIEDIRHDRHQ